MTGETERFNLIREKSGLSKKDFADSLGLSLSMSYQISSGRIKLPRELYERLTSVYNVNLHWFLTGIGSFNNDPDTVEVELLDQEAAAGRGREAEDYTEKRAFQVPRSFIAPYKPEKLLAVYVAGDSMIDEKINDGDIAIFHPQQKEGNGIYVVSVSNSLLVKRIDFDTKKKTITLISANPDYKPRRYTGDELKDIRIAGRVLACIHRV